MLPLFVNRISQCVMLAMILVQFGSAAGDCKLTLNKDFGQPAPVFIHNGGYMSPTNGSVTLKRSDTVTVACPGSKRRILLNNVTSGTNELEASCVNNSTFRVERWIGSFKGIRCDTLPWFTTEETSDTCYNGHRMYRTGYRVKNVFHSVYQSCFDRYQLATLYVIHTVSPRSKIIEGGQRPQFIEGDLFGKVRMSILYKAKTQADRINALLGHNKSNEYITNKQFLTRGHLAPRADFPMRAEQRASFHYVNTAPQWMRGNAGDWAALEEALRRRVMSLGRAVTVYTGTYGVMKLPDASGKMKELYLYADPNNNNLVPVPMYFYKVVYDPKTKQATAFISINSSFYTTSILRKLTFCDDICEGNGNFRWLRWRANDGTFSFCCDYQDFARTVPHLRHLDVRGVFY